MVRYKSEWKDVRAAATVAFIIGLALGMWIMGVIR